MGQPASDLGSEWVKVPKKFKGIKPTSHPTTLAYITDLERAMLEEADPHNSNIDKETHYGPGGIESLNDSGLGDAPGEAEGTGFGGDPGGYSGYGGGGLGGGYMGSGALGFGGLSPGEVAENAGVADWGGFGDAKFDKL